MNPNFEPCFPAPLLLCSLYAEYTMYSIFMALCLAHQHQHRASTEQTLADLPGLGWRRELTWLKPNFGLGLPNC